MASAMTVAVNITGTSTGLTSAVASSNKSLSTLGSSATKAQGPLKMLGGMGTALKTGLALGAVAAAKALFDMGAESQQITAQLEARLAALGSRTTITMGSLNDLALSIQNYSGISDEAVGASQAMLLTFQKVAVNPEIFDQATVAVADMATAMNNGATPSMEQMSNTAKMLGKALQDPITGATALGKAGVDKAVIAQAKAMAQAGDVIGAQTLILNELSGAQGEFAGSARAMGSTFAGQWNIIKENVGNAIEAIIVGMMKIVTPVAQVIGAILKFASATGLLTPLVTVIGILAIAWGVYAIAQSAAAASVVAFWGAWGPVTAVIAAVVVVVAGFIKLVQAGLSALSGGWSKMGGVMKAVLIATAPLWLPIVAVIKVVQLAIGAIGDAFSAIGGVISGFASTVAQLWNDFLAGLGPVGDALMKVGDLLGIFADTAAANAITATAEMNTFGLSVVLAAQQGSAAALKMGQDLMALKANMIALGQGTQWNAMFQAGVTSLDNALRSGNISVADAQKGYMAWGMSLDAAQARTAGLVPAITNLNSAVQTSFKTADVMASAWESAGAKVSGSLKSITKAITSSLKAELKLQSNTTKVTDRLINDYGLTAEQAERTLAGASPKAMATMAKASDKEFKKTGTAIQKVNHIIPSVAKNFDGANKSVQTTAKVAGQGAKASEGLGKGATAAGKGATTGAKGVTALGNSVQSGQSKVSGMVTQVGRLKTELNGLPKSIRIEVTVNVNKTGASTGGVVPGLARGGITAITNGLPLTMVGEHGPELAAMPPGSRVFSHNDTSGMLNAAMANAAAGGSGGPQRITGKLSLVNGQAYIEGVVLDTLDDGRVVDDVLSRKMKNP